MRLICPNCGAQYEVDASVIPSGGRDVQCSNCGHTWYQRSVSRPVEPEEAAQAAAKSEAAEAVETALEQASVSETAEAEQPAPDEVEAAGAAPEEQRQSTLDPEVSGILQEEAERELVERAAEQSASIEKQPDLGLNGSDEQRPPNAKERVARLRELDDELSATAAAAATAGAQRKDLLPDIEEINSSLTPDDEAGDEESIPEPVVAERARRAGFRRGFALAILVFAVMTLLYLYAPQIVQMNPQTEPAMAAYVDWVNGVREAVNGFMARTAERLTALLASMSSDA